MTETFNTLENILKNYTKKDNSTGSKTGEKTNTISNSSEDDKKITANSYEEINNNIDNNISTKDTAINTPKDTAINTPKDTAITTPKASSTEIKNNEIKKDVELTTGFNDGRVVKYIEENTILKNENSTLTSENNYIKSNLQSSLMKISDLESDNKKLYSDNKSLTNSYTELLNKMKYDTDIVDNVDEALCSVFSKRDLLNVKNCRDDSVSASLKDAIFRNNDIFDLSIAINLGKYVGDKDLYKQYSSCLSIFDEKGKITNKKLSNYLGVDYSDEFYDLISDQPSFDSFKLSDEHFRLINQNSGSALFLTEGVRYKTDPIFKPQDSILRYITSESLGSSDRMNVLRGMSLTDVDTELDRLNEAEHRASRQKTTPMQLGETLSSFKIGENRYSLRFPPTYMFRTTNQAQIKRLLANVPYIMMRNLEAQILGFSTITGNYVSQHFKTVKSVLTGGATISTTPTTFTLANVKSLFTKAEIISSNIFDDKDAICITNDITFTQLGFLTDGQNPIMPIDKGVGARRLLNIPIVISSLFKPVPTTGDPFLIIGKFNDVIYAEADQYYTKELRGMQQNTRVNQRDQVLFEQTIVSGSTIKPDLTPTGGKDKFRFVGFVHS